MRSSLSAALSFALLFAAPAPARALPTGPFETFVDGVPTGTLGFQPDTFVATDTCRYVGSWAGASGLLDEACWFDERIPLGFFACFTDTTVPSIVTIAAGLPCQALDLDGQDSLVFLMEFTEGAPDGSLTGLIQWTAAQATVWSFRAEPLAAAPPSSERPSTTTRVPATELSREPRPGGS